MQIYKLNIHKCLCGCLCAPWEVVTEFKATGEHTKISFGIPKLLLNFLFFFGFQISRDEYVLLSNNDHKVFSAEIVLKNYTSDFVFSRVTRRRINS